jgi:hypothetical protein
MQQLFKSFYSLNMTKACLKKKDLKNNTFKSISGKFPFGGFFVQFFVPFQEYNTFISEHSLESLEYSQYTKEQVIIDYYDDGTIFDWYPLNIQNTCTTVL